LEAAARVFAQRGFHAATVEEVAEEAGFSTGAVYSNFEGKGDLFMALFEEHVAAQVRDYTELFGRGRTIDEQARGGADAWMRLLTEDPDFFPLYIEFWSHAVRDPELRSRYAASFGAFRDTFARLIEAGARAQGYELEPAFAERLGTVVNALGNGLALEKLTDPEGVPDELLGWALSLFFQALAAAGQDADITELAQRRDAEAAD
jgi:AcrR family transcriptional regulator